LLTLCRQRSINGFPVGFHHLRQTFGRIHVNFLPIGHETAAKMSGKK
jgi:hypothetical protein